MRKKAITIAVGILLCSLVLASPSSAANSAQYGIEWDSIDAGGSSMSSSTYGLAGTAAQPVSGRASSSTYTLCTGYWCGTSATHLVYLPIVLSDS